MIDTTQTTQKAISLRQQGHTYPEISHALGVSVDWCKRNLKNIKKEKISDDCIREIVEKATRPEGLTVYEANAIIFKHNPEKELTKDQVKNIRKKALYQDENCLFRPGWVDATKPLDSYKHMLAWVDYLMDEIDKAVDEHSTLFPSINKQSVRYEIMKHVFPKISSEPLLSRMMRSENIVETLHDRNIQEVVIEDEMNMGDTHNTLTSETDINLLHHADEGTLTEDELDDIWNPTPQITL